MDVPSVLVASGTLITSIGTVLVSLGIRRQVKTENGLSVGQLADRREAQRIMLEIRPEDRTASEQAYVEKLIAQGRNVGHEGQQPGPVRPDPPLMPRPAPAPHEEPLPLAGPDANPSPPVDQPPGP